MRPEDIAAEVLGVNANRLHATRIKGGLTNESWCVEGAADAVVVRISTADEHALQLNRHSEVAVLPVVEQAGIGAQILLCEPQRRLLVTRKLAADTLTLEALREPAVIKMLAAVLRHLHALTAPAAVQHSDLHAILQGYWHSLDALALPNLVEMHARQRALEIASESAQAFPRCLCHNDVHHLNLLSNQQQLWLLDWEYAGIGDPFFDLAAVCCYHNYDAALRDQLLLAYGGVAGQKNSERLQRMCWLFDYIKALWLAVRNLSP